MNKITLNTICLVLMTTIFFSCKKEFLEIVPVGNLVAKSVTDYDLLMNSKALYSYSNGLPMLILSDEVAADATSFQSTNPESHRLFYWEDIVYNQQGTVWDIQNYTSNLYLCNKVIAEVTDATGGTDEKKKAILGEAIATRAWIYFQLINLYGKPYSSSASSDLGFPIITTADVTKNNFSRNTVGEVYSFMVSDLTTAIPLLPINNGIRTRMSKQGAEALLGKIYLFMGKNAEALAQLDAAYNDNISSMAPATLYDYNVTLGTDGSFLPIGPMGPNYPGNNETDLTESLVLKTSSAESYNYLNGIGRSGLLLDPQAANLFDPTDLRLKLYSDMNDDGTAIPGGKLRKYAVTISHVGIELSDLILLRAEVRARTGNLSGAKSDVELLRTNRMPAANVAVPSGIAANQSLLIKFIIDERIREFACEGHRWFDMRRLSLDPLFSSTTYVHHVFAADGSLEQTYTLKPARLTMRLPQSIIDANPGMTNNP